MPSAKSAFNIMGSFVLFGWAWPRPASRCLCRSSSWWGWSTGLAARACRCGPCRGPARSSARTSPGSAAPGPRPEASAQNCASATRPGGGAGPESLGLPLARGLQGIPGDSRPASTGLPLGPGPALVSSLDLKAPPRPVPAGFFFGRRAWQIACRLRIGRWRTGTSDAQIHATPRPIEASAQGRQACEGGPIAVQRRHSGLATAFALGGRQSWPDSSARAWTQDRALSRSARPLTPPPPASATGAAGCRSVRGAPRSPGCGRSRAGWRRSGR